MRTTHTEDRQRQVTDLIVAGEMAPDAIDAVVAAGLAAYAMDRIGDQQQSLDPRLHRSRLVAAARHAAIRRATASLVRAWDEAGIDTLLFKGFYLAEFVYPDPSWRAYSDVDLAVRSRADLSLSEVARLAAEVAARHEFEVVWWHGEEERLDSHHDRAYNGHELLQLAHIPTGTSVDAHRRLVHSNVSVRRQSDKGERLTRSVWERATASEFEGATVYLPAHIDSALVGLIAARSWSGDRHALRPHDPLDLDMLMRRGGFGRVELREPSPARAFWYDALLVSERGHRGLAQFSAAAAAAPGRVMAVLRELPAAARQV
ncbi:MAG TPA: nucleotidyltransferase family protein, partial [Trueperaceae bacterium]|nr:nucleotidyltransferase family protein [Trueperaceae bacterium]